MNRDEWERTIFEKALNLKPVEGSRLRNLAVKALHSKMRRLLPGTVEPYDSAQRFDADELMDGFFEERRVIHAADDPVLGEMAGRAERAWADFLAEHDVE